MQLTERARKYFRNKLKGAYMVLKEFDKHSPKPLLYSFIMTKKEKALFDATVKESNAYLEFGMGGSTLRVLEKSKAKIFSIDSSREWIKIMREYSLVRAMEKRRLSLFHVNIGPTKEWGRPAGDGSKELYPDYSSSIFNLIGQEKEHVDTVLIDGRFRVACTLKTILECHKNKNLKILIHDFWNRDRYHIVLKYLNEIGRADTLGLFKIKRDIDLNAIRSDYNTYKYNFS